MVKESMPEAVTHDSRLGRKVRSQYGFVGVVDKIWRFSDGEDVVHLYDEQSGIGEGGLYWEQITFLDEEE